MARRSSLRLAAAVGLLLAINSRAQAVESGQGDTPDTGVATPDSSGSPAAPAAPPSIQSSLGAYGDPGGLRAYLDSKGIDYAFTYIGETLGNGSGGAKRGATYEGRLDATLDIDLDKLAGLKGLAAHAEAYQIHGRSLTGNNTLDIFTVSNIDAFPSTKLYEAWFEQKLADDKVAIRVGQLAVDTEFVVSQTATVFINSSFGFPALAALDLPSGGPAYPLGALGARIKATPFENVTILAAILDGDPAGPYRPGVNDVLPQVRDFRGTNFRLQDPPLIITEAAYAYNQDKKSSFLPGTVKLGYFHHFGQFEAFDRVAGSTSTGNDGFYGVIDQAVYRVPGTDDQGAAVFLRMSGAPSDRNIVDFYVDGGIAYKGLIPGRPDDTAGASAIFARISRDYAQAQVRAGQPAPDYQASLELTYQIAVIPGVTLQPDFQYIFRPGAGSLLDVDGRPLRDAAVFGLRASAHY